MKPNFLNVVMLGVLVFVPYQLNATVSQSSDQETRQIEIKKEVAQLSESIKEVRRDQLNYQIEKNLLKETYQVNYERFNFMVTILLGVFGVLGFLGVKDIKSVKKDYDDELEKLRTLRSELALKFKNFESATARYDEKLREITESNAVQNKKIQVIEMKEKINNLLELKSFQRALEYCTLALELAPNDIELVENKAKAYRGLLDYSSAIAEYEKMISLTEETENFILDFAEVLLFDNEVGKYRALKAENEKLFEEECGGRLKYIFEMLAAYHQNDSNQIKANALKVVEVKDATKAKRIDDWDFAEIKEFVEEDRVSEGKALIVATVEYLEGKISGTQFAEKFKIVS